MNKIFFCAILLSTLFFSCKKDDNSTPRTNTNSDYKYVVLSTIGTNSYLGTYDSIPTDSVDNLNSNTLQRNAIPYFRQYGDKWLFTRTNGDGTAGLTKYALNADNSKLQQTGFIAFSDNLGLNSGQSVVVNDTLGYYIDAGRSKTAVQKFNPTTMQRTGDIDLNNTTVTDGWTGTVYVGAQLIFVHDNKLFVSVTYSAAGQDGYNYNLKSFKMAVVDIASGQFEKTIQRDDVVNIGWGLAENPSYVNDDQGNVYICTYGWDWDSYSTSTALVPNWKPATIFRMKAGSTDFDENWSVKMADIGITENNGGPWFVSIGYNNGMLYVEAQPNLDGVNWYTSTFNTDPWYIYAIDPSSKSYSRVKKEDGTDLTTSYAMDGSGSNLSQVGDDLYARVPVSANGKTGYFYKLNGSTATKVFGLEGSAEPDALTRLKKN